MGQRSPVKTTRVELKRDAAREEQKKLIAQGWERTQENWAKKSARVTNP